MLCFWSCGNTKSSAGARLIIMLTRQKFNELRMLSSIAMTYSRQNAPFLREMRVGDLICEFSLLGLMSHHGIPLLTNSECYLVVIKIDIKWFKIPVVTHRTELYHQSHESLIGLIYVTYPISYSWD